MGGRRTEKGACLRTTACPVLKFGSWCDVGCLAGRHTQQRNAQWSGHMGRAIGIGRMQRPEVRPHRPADGIMFECRWPEPRWGGRAEEE